MNRSVLVVDDSLTVRMDLVEALAAAGLLAVPCATIADARHALVTENVGLVVLDVILPDGDGIDFLKEIRSAHGDLPVLMLSSEADAKDRILGLRTGADEYVGKPYDSRYVVAKALEFLSRRQTRVDGRPVVLLIDDSPTFRHSLAATLDQQGYEVLQAANAEDGLAMMARRRPDAVIVDGVMPGMDGATLLRRVRLDAALRATPCLLLTASGGDDAELHALDAGADAFVRKDEDMDIILARLAAIMRQSLAADGGKLASLADPHKILAIDDSITYLNEVADALRGEGYDVAFARSGEEALEFLAIQSVDCALLDLVMPGLGGMETCRRIKAAPMVRDTPVIIVTALDDRDLMLEGLGAGADDYVSKSNDFEVLKARVRAQIRRKQFQDENRRIRDEFLRRDREAEVQHAAREIAEARAAMVEELERKVDQRTRELETQIIERRQSERMASVGMLAASIAHEINNPLAVVTTALGIVSDGLDKWQSEAAAAGADAAAGIVGERLADLVEVMRAAVDASERVRQIVGDLRLFVRSEETEAVRPVDVNRILESTIRLASNEVRHRAKLTWSLGDVRPVVGSESRLGQVFLNLLVNAAQAIPEGHAESNTIGIATWMDSEGRVIAEISDSGAGIPPEQIGRIFEPFFTTKSAAQGTGLGLAICRRLIAEFGGEISVSSEVGKGSAFRVTLPAQIPLPGSAELAKEPDAAPNAGGQRCRLLVIDDEPALGKMIVRILSADHEVAVTTSAKEADRMIAGGARFDAILCDLMMPEMSGMELHERLQESVPEQAARMLFMTGGVFSERAATFLRVRSTPAISKPFKSADLRRIVRSFTG